MSMWGGVCVHVRTWEQSGPRPTRAAVQVQEYYKIFTEGVSREGQANLKLGSEAWVPLAWIQGWYWVWAGEGGDC